MGKTRMSKKEVDALIGRLMREWPGRRYDILEHNCCHFSAELCRRLGVGSLPDWVTSLARVGADLRNFPHTFPQDVQDLAIHGLKDMVDLWQAPQYITNDIHQVRPRNEPAICHMQSPRGRRGLAKHNDVNHAHANRALVEEQFGDFSVNERIEIFSNSYQVWCKGQVKSFNKDPMQKLVKVAFRTPDAAIDEIKYKDLPLDSKEIRKATRGGC